MKTFFEGLSGLFGIAGINVGFIMTVVFLYHQWGALGIGLGLTFAPPLLICPIWEWCATGHWLTFLVVYGFGFGGMLIHKALSGED